jgi:hypothetical protein
MINTQWIALIFSKKKNEMENTFLYEFYIATLLDYLVYQIFLIKLKAFVFFLIVKDREKTWWKTMIISIISLCPWFFSLFG